MGKQGLGFLFEGPSARKWLGFDLTCSLSLTLQSLLLTSKMDCFSSHTIKDPQGNDDKLPKSPLPSDTRISS